MTSRITLTGLWLFSFLLALILVESYVGKIVLYNGINLNVLLEGDRLDAMKPVFTIYSAYIAAILGFWFAKPFKAVESDGAEKIRFWIAIFCTLIFNAWVIYMIGRGHFGAMETVMADINNAVKIATWMSVVVAPVNAYYFGMKLKKAIS